MPTAPPIGATIYLPPDDTIAAWQERDPLRRTVAWSEMMHEAHAQAFTVAKVAKLDLLTSIRASLDDVIARGGTFEEWRANILPELKRHGWWGAVRDAELTGTSDLVVVNDRRLRTIYRTNIRMSIAAGRWRKFQREKASFPYLRYLSDHYRKHPRLDHRSWHGLLLPIDHPWWQTHFPPNGWGCNCNVEQVSERRRRQEGWDVGEPPDDGQRGFRAADGRLYQVPEGVSPAFAYNPGTAHLVTVGQRAFQAVADAVKAGNMAAPAVLGELLSDPVAMGTLLSRPGVVLPAGVLRPADAAAIGSEARVVALSADTIAKQTVNHPELSIGAYVRAAQALLGEPIRLRQDARHLLVLWRDDAGRWWRQAIKTTESGTEIYVVSLHRLSADEVGRLRARLPEVE